MGVIGKIMSVFGKGEATLYQGSTGKQSVLLNPHQKAAKYSSELRGNVKLTNGGDVKSVGPLSAREIGYRQGYIASNIDQTKLHFSKNKKK